VDDEPELIEGYADAVGWTATRWLWDGKQRREAIEKFTLMPERPRSDYHGPQDAVKNRDRGTKKYSK